eukprot:3720767-Ditylum_brightwellii.AAC.2
MLTREFNSKLLQEQLELAGVIGDITQTVFTMTKGNWQIKMSKTHMVETILHVAEVLEKYKDKFPDEEKEQYPALPYLRMLNTYAVSATYTKTLISNNETTHPNSSYDCLPNTWTRSPSGNIVANTQKQNRYQMSLSNKQPTTNNNTAKNSNNNKEI